MAEDKSIIPSADHSDKQPTLFHPQMDARIRHEIINGVVCYSVLDVFEYGGSAGSASNPREYWQNAQRQLKKQGLSLESDVTIHLHWRHADQKGGKGTPMAAYKFFLRLVQAVDIKEWEMLRQWMADLAHERLEEMQTPGLASQNARKRDLALLQSMGYADTEAAQYLEDRIKGVDGFKLLMDTVQKVCEQPQYGKIVNTEYVSLFGETADKLKEILSTKSVRDKLPQLQYQYLRTAEVSLREVIKRQNQLSMDQILGIVERVVKPLGGLLKDICATLGIHHITGQPLMSASAQAIQKAKQQKLIRGGR